MKIEGKKIIVTGGASGIGKELVTQLLKEGAFVSAVDINQDNLTKLTDELKNANLKTYVADISKKESLETFKNSYMHDNEYVDILINNAGIVQPFVQLEDLDDATINRVMNINFFGQLNLIRLFIKDLKLRKEAYIVNVSSMAGFFPFPKQTIYGASKAAVKIFTEGLYAELLDTNVHVMAVFPGAIHTDILKNSGVEIKNTGGSSNYKMTEANDAASQIIMGIKKNKFELYVGSDSKFMHWLYNFNSKMAIEKINAKMKDIN